MDEELLKRNTDCVYYLASPFTCKKGADCEYRHSEMARLNPRDCWFWLSGNCLNPTCGFRHPPMDTQAETSPEAELLPNNTSLPPSKNSVPCFFYFNGYCGKGDKCSFLHGSEDTPAGKLKIDSAPTFAPIVDTKPPKASVPKIAVEKTKVPSTPVPKINAEKPEAKVSSTPPNNNRHARMTNEVQKMQIQSPDTYAIVERKTLQNSVSPEFEVPENINRSDPSIDSDQSSEDQVDTDVVRDEWWESSPGFDVLVEGEQGYMHGYDGNDDENQFQDHHYRDQNDFGDSFLHENELYDSDDDERYDLTDYSHGDRESNHIMAQKRKLVTIGLPDLRDHLSKRRFHEARDSLRLPNFPLHTEERRVEPRRSSNQRFHGRIHEERDSLRHPNLPLHIEERRVEPRRSSNQRFHGRLASRLERNGVSLITEKSAFVVSEQRVRTRDHQLNTRPQHHHHERKRLEMNSRAQRRPFSKQKRENNNNSAFSAPKTLAQIKEEKDRAKKRGSSGGEEDINICS